MADPLDAELDSLFQRPLGDFVAARNALADTLRRAGDKASAARVKAIKRASPVAWALNQLHFTQPELLERARTLTAELRALQTHPGVEGRRLASAVEAQRVAAQAVVEGALRAGRGAGLSETALQQRKLFTTVQAWLAGKGDESPGRMTQELEASGFDAFAGMTLPLPAPSPAPSATAAATAATVAVVAATPELDRAGLEAAMRDLADREQAAAAARDHLNTRKAALTAAQQARDQILASIRETEHKLAELRTVLEQRERDLERRTTALDEARTQHEQAIAAADAARAALKDLEG